MTGQDTAIPSAAEPFAGRKSSGPRVKRATRQETGLCGGETIDVFVVPVLGWLHKEVQSSNKMSSLKMKKRWFVLTNTALDYYKSSERTAAKLGTLVLNSLCSVVQPDERVFKDTGKRKEAVMSRCPMCGVA